MRKAGPFIAIVLAVAVPAVATVQGSPLPRIIEHSHPHRLPFSDLICLTDHQIRQNLARAGYTHIYLNAANGPHREARVTRGAWVYLVEMYSCTGEIYAIRRLRRS